LYGFLKLFLKRDLARGRNGVISNQLAKGSRRLIIGIRIQTVRSKGRPQESEHTIGSGL